MSKKDNYIIGEIEIDEDNINQDILIINSFKNIKRGNKYMKDKEDDYKKMNEKEIKEKCIIQINNKIIPFSYYYKFDKEGKYTIKYIFKDKLNVAFGLFCGCKCLTSLNLSNFDTQNVTNMCCMF